MNQKTTWFLRNWLMQAVLSLAVSMGLSGTAIFAQPLSTEAQELAHFWREAQAGSVTTSISTSSREFRTMSGALLARATPDECFLGIGKTPLNSPWPCVGEGQPKVNQSYVWGLTKAGQTLWLGTIANTQCMILGGVLVGADSLAPLLTSSYVCEFGSSAYRALGIPAELADFRSPRIYQYDLIRKVLIDKTPRLDPRAGVTMGFRSAGTDGEVVLLAGPSLSLTGGVNVFAFQASTGVFLGSKTLPGYNNVRRFFNFGGALYVGVGKVGGGGSVLRWTGSAANPFTFDTVGNLEGDAAELAVHEGRMFVATWPPLGALGTQRTMLAGLFMSPAISAEGLTEADANDWKRVWSASDYEPDPVVALSYGGGALASFNGALYWGTMHVPFAATKVHLARYGQPERIVETALGTHRASAIFRGRGFGANSPAIELLYGSSMLPTFDPAAQTDDGKQGKWKLVENKMAAQPRFGQSGFGNLFNNYTWTMAVYGGRLWVGTMDWSYLLADAAAALVSTLPPDQAPQIGNVPLEDVLSAMLKSPLSYGADLFSFAGLEERAEAEDVGGLGNPASYGIRNLLSADALYVGMANPMNLLVGPQAGEAQGGWELLALQDKNQPPPNTPVGVHVSLDLEAGVKVKFCRVVREGATNLVSLEIATLPALPALPPGGGRLKAAFLMTSTAQWQDGCLGTVRTSEAAATVYVPTPPSGGRLWQLRASASNVQTWREITVHQERNQVVGDLVPETPLIFALTVGMRKYSFSLKPE